jgi:nitrous oxidase accessory protein NosD
VPSDSGYVFLVNCARITIQGLSIHDDAANSAKSNSNGIFLLDTVDSAIMNCYVTAGTGISVSGSATKNITVYQNTIGTAARLFQCYFTDNSITNGGELIADNSTVVLNRIDSCEHGITIDGGKNNHIFQNNITNCNIGVFILNAANNTIHRNNFINYSQPVFEEHYKLVPSMFGPFNASFVSVNNTWDGNFWSEYNGIDRDGNGIGDTPYVIFENITDHYPLMHIVDISYATPEPEPSEPFPTALIIAASGASIAIIGMGLLVYFKKRKR